ncbi:MAG: hypothetical protein ACOX9E_11850 [Lentisphaeria bacterium]|jgi:hypothetical protein
MNNTIVVAMDHNYVWGAYMMIASLRYNQMPEPVIVLGFGLTEADHQALLALNNVRVVDGESSTRNLTCCKPDAMLLAETDYITWVDCDSFFIGNCSDRLLWPDHDMIHIRLREEPENAAVYRHLGGQGKTPSVILDAWRQDVGERSEARLATGCSACFMSLHRKHLPFVRRWSEQIAKVLPEDNVGVVDRRSFAYFQTDESVLNSLLCFAEVAPTVSPYYKLDKDPTALFVHFISRPKPWECWTPRPFRYFRQYTAVLDWVLAQKLPLPGPVPLALRSDRYLTNYLRSRFSVPRRKFHTLLRRLRQK